MQLRVVGYQDGREPEFLHVTQLGVASYQDGREPVGFPYDTTHAELSIIRFRMSKVGEVVLFINNCLLISPACILHCL